MTRMVGLREGTVFLGRKGDRGLSTWQGAGLVSMQELESLPRRVVCWKLFLQLFEVCVFFQIAELTQKC